MLLELTRLEDPAECNRRRASIIDGREIVTVVPITHTAPKDPTDAIEIPAALKAHFGLDDLPSWIVLTETNDFIWPGPDIRPIPGRGRNFAYGMLPPRFFAHLRDRILRGNRERKLNRVARSE